MAASRDTPAGLSLAHFSKLRQTINTSHMEAWRKAQYLQEFCELYENACARVTLPTKDPRLTLPVDDLEADMKTNVLFAEDSAQAVAGAERDEEVLAEGQADENEADAYDKGCWRRYDECAVALIRRMMLEEDQGEVSLGASREESGKIGAAAAVENDVSMGAEREQ